MVKFSYNNFHHTIETPLCPSEGAWRAFMMTSCQHPALFAHVVAKVAGSTIVGWHIPNVFPGTFLKH